MHHVSYNKWEIRLKIAAISIGQTNHVLLNMATNYNARLLATQIQHYFQVNPAASEILIFKGQQAFSIKRAYALHKMFVISFTRKYGK